MPSQLGSLLAELDARLARLGAGWYLIGAQAAILHGSARVTADVDATVDLGARTVAELLAALAPSGFLPRVADPEAFAGRTRVVPLVHGPSGLPVDLVLAGPGLEPLFLSRAVRIELEGVSVPVARAEDLVAMKLLAGRPKDVEDAAAILAARQPSFDLALVRETLALLEQSLDRSDLLAQLEQLVGARSRP